VAVRAELDLEVPFGRTEQEELHDLEFPETAHEARRLFRSWVPVERRVNPDLERSTLVVDGYFDADRIDVGAR
jgi:hypothetical protein